MTHKEYMAQDDTSRNQLYGVAYCLWLEAWPYKYPSDRDTADLKSFLEKWQEEWYPHAFLQEHCGDCTNDPAPCGRCSIEQLFEDAYRILYGRAYEHD